MNDEEKSADRQRRIFATITFLFISIFPLWLAHPGMEMKWKETIETNGGNPNWHLISEKIEREIKSPNR